MTLPCIATCPLPSSYSDVLKTVASVLALPLALITFYLGYRQREGERTRGYYHKAVIDVVLPQLIEFFDLQLEKVVQAARDATKGLNSLRKTMPPGVTKSLAEFSASLFEMQDVITNRTLIFDEKVTELIRKDFEQIQDDVANWFGELALRKSREIEELPGLVKKGQRAIIKHLYSGKFKN
jgi:hypothetical protein